MATASCNGSYLGPDHLAVPIAHAPQLSPFTGLILDISSRLLPAHCIVVVMVTHGNLRRSFREYLRDFPPTTTSRLE